MMISWLFEEYVKSISDRQKVFICIDKSYTIDSLYIMVIYDMMVHTVQQVLW